MIVSSFTSSPILFLVIAGYVYVGYRLQMYLFKLSNEITRLKGITSSPMVQYFAETLNGVTWLRSYDKFNQSFFRYLNAQDDNFKNKIASMGCSNWFSLRINLISLVVTIPALIFSVNNHL